MRFKQGHKSGNYGSNLASETYNTAYKDPNLQVNPQENFKLPAFAKNPKPPEPGLDPTHLQQLKFRV